MASTHSADLQWELVKKNNKFLQKRGNVRLSNDPFNNSGRYTRRHAGFVATKAAVVKVKGEKEIYLTTKDASGDNANKPKKMYKVTAFPKGSKASAVSKEAAKVRPDLADVVFRRARKISNLLTRQQKVRDARKKHCASIKHKRTHKNVQRKKGGKK